VNNTIVCVHPDWYLAAEGVFAGALLLLLVALVVESLFACCQCCLHRSCAPTSVACFTIAAGMTRYNLRMFSAIQAYCF